MSRGDAGCKIRRPTDSRGYTDLGQRLIGLLTGQFQHQISTNRVPGHGHPLQPELLHKMPRYGANVRRQRREQGAGVQASVPPQLRMFIRTTLQPAFHALAVNPSIAGESEEPSRPCTTEPCQPRSANRFLLPMSATKDARNHNRNLLGEAEAELHANSHRRADAASDDKDRRTDAKENRDL